MEITKDKFCLVLGSSPSVDTYDIEKLKEKFYCIACNEWAGTGIDFDCQVINHTNLIFNTKFNEKGKENLIKLLSSNKFKICTDTLQIKKYLNPENSYYLNGGAKVYENECVPVYDKLVYRPGTGTVIGSAINVALVKNYKNIYLLGVDFKKEIFGYSYRYIMPYINMNRFSNEQKESCYYNDEIISMHRVPYYKNMVNHCSKNNINISSLSYFGPIADWDWFPQNDLSKKIISERHFT